MSCTRSEPCITTDEFVAAYESGPLNSAIFRAAVVKGLISEVQDPKFIAVEKISSNGTQDTLKMYRSKANGVAVNHSSYITAAFPCPRECYPTDSGLLLIPPTIPRIFCVEHIKEIFKNGNLTGLAFHMLNENESLGMYGVIIDENNNQHERHNILTAASNHKVYKAKYP